MDEYSMTEPVGAAETDGLDGWEEPAAGGEAAGAAPAVPAPGEGAEELPEAAQERQRQEAVRRDVQAFLRDYPEVRARDIPEEVWTDMHENGVSMSAAYGKYQVRVLQRQVEEANAAAASRRRSAGSLAHSLAAGQFADPAFAGWED